MEALELNTSTSPERTTPLVMYASAFLLAVWIIHILLRRGFEPGRPARLAATGLLLVGVALLVLAEVRLIRRLGELQRHVQPLALAIAFGGSLVAIFAIGFLRAESFLQRGDPRDLPAVLLFLCLAGLTIARRRYQ